MAFPNDRGSLEDRLFLELVLKEPPPPCYRRRAEKKPVTWILPVACWCTACCLYSIRTVRSHKAVPMCKTAAQAMRNLHTMSALFTKGILWKIIIAFIALKDSNKFDKINDLLTRLK